MKLDQALKTYKPIKLPHHTKAVYQYFKPKTGPHYDLVDCSYFIVYEEDLDEWFFSTSLDLYPEEILSDQWEVYEE